MKILTNQQLGILYTVSSGLCYGLLGYFGVSLTDTGLSIYNMLFWRFIIAVFFMLVVMWPNYAPLKRNQKENCKVLFYGIFFYSGSAIAYFLASKYIGTGLAMVVFFIYPAFVMLYNTIAYKTRVSATYYAAFLIMIVGMVFLADMQKTSFDIVGAGFGLLAAIFYAGYMIASKQSNVAPMVSTLMVSIGCAITCLICALIDASFYIPTGMNNWFNIICVAIVCTALPILLLLRALRYISSEQASILSVFEPIFVLFFGVVLLDECVTTTQLVGTIIVLSGALMTLLKKPTPE